MGNKIIKLTFSSPYSLKGEAIIRSIIYVDESNGERAIDKIKKAVEKQYLDKLFTKHAYGLSSIETLWEE